MKNSSDLTPEEYNEVVYYCGSCHSLCIVTDDSLAGAEWDGSYCAKCYSTDVCTCTMGEWLKEEERRVQKRREIEWSK